MNIRISRKKIARTLALAAVTAAVAGLAGCASTARETRAPQNGAALPRLEATRYSIENTGKFVLMDPATQGAVTCTGLQERVTADGRLEIVANVKNLAARRVRIQINCVFKDARQIPTGDETPWKNLALGENETKAVRFASMNNLAKTFTIHVRQAR